MPYSALLLQHFHHPQYAGRLASGPGVYEAQVSIPSGDQVRLAIATENSHIKDIRYQVFGCPATIACMSWVATELINQDFMHAKQVTAASIQAALSLPAHKYRCALLAEQALEKVLQQWYNAGK
ncbi:MAG: iron-sulfur cluster assembly scaffold protein [Gammaproteobacteria bacterium]